MNLARDLLPMTFACTLALAPAALCDAGDPCPDGVIFVDEAATGAGTGTSWADAYNHLQDALASAGPGVEIWVAQGAYRPDENAASPTGTGDRTATFGLATDVAIYGAFPIGGGDCTFGARDVQLFVTILSGDLQADDVVSAVGIANNTENSYHVVSGDSVGSTAILDGFTIRGGNADGASPFDAGGGLYILEGTPTIRACTITENTATTGGGMYSSTSSAPMVSTCAFVGNLATSGGGMYADQFSYATIINCTFVSNDGTYGGGIYGVISALTVANCTFVANSAVYGGGLYANLVQISTLSNCTMTANSAYLGGAIYSDDVSGPNQLEVANSILWGNLTHEGEHIRTYTGSPSMRHCDIQGSGGSGAGWLLASSDGGGNIDADPLFLDANGPDCFPSTADDQVGLSPASPCLDAGRNDLVAPDAGDLDDDGDTVEALPVDLAGTDRFLDAPGADCPQAPGACGSAPVVDMGPYEHCAFCPNGVPADVNADGAVNTDDLLAVLLAWGPCENACPEDIDGNGVVDVDDLIEVISNWS